jgi:NTP pyrophosphatase (non-canonical NTP hydrolase)
MNKLKWAGLTSTQTEILEDAIKTWGEASQVAVAIGEIGEFLSEVGKTAQGRSTIERTVDEIADVIICMLQIALIINPEGVQKRVVFKLNQLRARMERAHMVHQGKERHRCL